MFNQIDIKLESAPRLSGAAGLITLWACVLLSSLEAQRLFVMSMSCLLLAGSALFIRRYLLLKDKRSITHLKLMPSNTFLLTLASGKVVEAELKSQRVLGQQLIVLAFDLMPKKTRKRWYHAGTSQAMLTAFISSEHVALRRGSRRLAFQHNAMRRLRVLLNNHYFD